MKGLKSLFKQSTNGVGGVKVTAAPSSSNKTEDGEWENFSNTSPTGFGFAAEEPHPLIKEWSARISNRNVRAAFLKEPIEGYTIPHDLRVWTGTWNTNGKSPPPNLDISEWIHSSAEGRPDIVVVGFQEIVPLTPGKVLAVEDSVATAEWEDIIEKALNQGSASPSTFEKSKNVSDVNSAHSSAHAPVVNPFIMENLWSGKPVAGDASGGANEGWTDFDAPFTGAGDSERGAGEDRTSTLVEGWTPFDVPSGATSAGDEHSPTYVRLACKQLVGVYITVWATVDVASHTRDVRVNTVSTGINLGVGILGNKGGAAVWMKVYATPVVFICSHLSAGTKEGDELKRSEDFNEILSKLSFQAPPTASSDGSSLRAATVADAFAAVWIGDLNYRLNLPDDVVRSAIAAGDHARLMSGDQLRLEQSAGRAFVGWTEAPVTFPPTYKYRPGTNVYSGAAGPMEPTEPGEEGVPVSMKEEKKKRTPAWCDRVLWQGHDIRQTSYARAELVQSDHKPVMAEFVLTGRELQPKRLQGVLENLRRKLDAAEMASQPRCMIENPQADLGQLRYAEPKSTSFQFVNTGDVAATWRFVPPMPGDSALAPSWLTLSPVEGTLLPGEEIEIRATAWIRGSGASGPAAITGISGGGASGSSGGAMRSIGDARGAAGEPGVYDVVGADGALPSLSSSERRVEAGTAATEAGTIAEAARRAAVRAVGSGLATPTGSGGITPATQPSTPARAGSYAALASLADLSSHPLDAIIVLHLDKGRDFFLTIAGEYIPSVFGQPLGSLPSAAFPPNVPEPIGTLVDYLFDKGLSVPGLLQPPARCTAVGLGAVRAALDRGWGGAADLASTPGVDCHEAAGALLSMFASLPQPLLATPPLCCAAVDAMMTPWANAAAAVARAGPAGAWTLATPNVVGQLPVSSTIDELLRRHLPAPERATLKHTTAFIHALLKVPLDPDTMPTSSRAARILAQFAEVWFPTTGAAATVRMGRVAFLGILCGAHPEFLDGFNPMERMYDPDSTILFCDSIFSRKDGLGMGEEPGAVAGFEGGAQNKSSGNLIDL